VLPCAVLFYAVMCSAVRNGLCGNAVLADVWRAEKSACSDQDQYQQQDEQEEEEHEQEEEEEEGEEQLCRAAAAVTGGGRRERSNSVSSDVVSG
jgi:hypothetical protein